MWALLEGGWWESTSGRRWHLSRALRDPHSSVSKESACNAGDPGSIPGLGRSPGGGIGYPLQCSWASLVAQLAKNSACNAGDLGLIPGLGRSPREGKGSPLQYSGLENPMGCIVHGVAKSWTEWLSLLFRASQHKGRENWIPWKTGRAWGNMLLVGRDAALKTAGQRPLTRFQWW